jgi:hypothetical protein
MKKQPASDAQILKYKKFSQLEFTLNLTHLALEYLQSWTLLGDDPYYMSVVIQTLRSLYTYIKNLAPRDTKHHELFLWPQHHQLVKQEKIKNRDDVVRAVTQLGIVNTDYN